MLQDLYFMIYIHHLPEVQSSWLSNHIGTLLITELNASKQQCVWQTVSSRAACRTADAYWSLMLFSPIFCRYVVDAVVDSTCIGFKWNNTVVWLLMDYATCAIGVILTWLDMWNLIRGISCIEVGLVLTSKGIHLNVCGTVEHAAAEFVIHIDLLMNHCCKESLPRMVE